MSFDQQNNSKDNKNSVNTRGVQFFNRESFCPSTLSVGFWNELISIKINPALPKDQQSEAKIYDYTKSVITTLSIDKASALIYEIENTILPALKEGEKLSISVPTSLDSLLTVGVGELKGVYMPYVAIHKGIQQNKIPQMSIYYEFNPINLVEDYNENNGEFKVKTSNLSEFLAFTYILKASVFALTHANTHSHRFVGKWNNDKLNGMIEEISSKLGISSSFINKSSYKGKVSILWETGTTQQDQQTYNNATESISNLDELNEFMN